MHNIKAVALDVTFGRIELADYFVEAVTEPVAAAPPAAAPEAENAAADDAATPSGPAAQKKDEPPAPAPILSAGQIQALRKLMSSQNPRYERLVVNIPKARVTTRLFNFPTKDRKVIQSSLLFELEDDIPFPLDATVRDFAIVKTESSSSTVYTAIALKADITALLSELQMLGLDPDSITIDPWASSHLLRRAMPQGFAEKPVCMANIGATSTGIHVCVGSEPVVSHVSAYGGNQITQAIANAYGLTIAEAERAKIDGAFFITETHLKNDPGITDEQKQFSTVLEDAIAPLVRELKQTLIAYKSNYHHPVRAIFLTGGTSLIPNLALYLEEKLQVPVFPYSYISSLVGQTLQLSDTTEAHISTAVGLALTMVKPERNAIINFRKDEFSKQGGIGAVNLGAYRKIAVYAAAALAFIYANLIVQYLVLSARSEKQEAHLERAVKQVLGAVSPSTLSTYVNSPSALKAAVEKELAKFKTDQPLAVKLPLSGLDLLGKVSSAMPRDMVLDVNLFQFKEGRLRLTGVVEGLPNVDKILKGLENSKTLTEIAKGKVEEEPKKKTVKFEFTAKVAEVTPGAGKAK